jgi:hypothetical protein
MAIKFKGCQLFPFSCNDCLETASLKECSQKLTTVNMSINQLKDHEVMMQLFGITSFIVFEMKENPIVGEPSLF